MNKNIIKGSWKNISGRIVEIWKKIVDDDLARKDTWGRLTDDDLMNAESNDDYLTGKLREAYGLTKGEGDKELNEL